MKKPSGEWFWPSRLNSNMNTSIPFAFYVELLATLRDFAINCSKEVEKKQGNRSDHGSKQKWTSSKLNGREGMTHLRGAM